MKSWTLLVLGVAIGVAGVAHAGMLDDENANKVTQSSTPAGAVGTIDANGVAMPGFEKVDPELQKVREEAKCVQINKRPDGTIKSSESVKCTEVDYASAAPKAEGNTQQDTAMGGDARNQQAYNPPKNLKINGQEISWGKYESFKQIGESHGYSQASIQGIAGRLQVESNYFSPNKSGAQAQGDYMGGKYTSFGAMQWHKDRGDDLVAYINDKREVRNDSRTASLSPAGLKYSAYDQSNYVFEEMPSEMRGRTDALKNATSAADAAQLFTVYNERPATQAGQAWNRAGGNATYNNALGFANAGSNEYIADTSAWGSKSLANYNSNAGGYGLKPDNGSSSNGTGGLFSGNSGLGTTVQQFLSGNMGSGGVQGIINNVVSGVMGGNSNSAQNQLVASLLNGGLGSLLGGGSDGGSGRNDSGVSIGSSYSYDPQTGTYYETADSGSLSLTGYEAVQILKSVCGTSSGTVTSKDAFMLMIRSCQAVSNATS